LTTRRRSPISRDEASLAERLTSEPARRDQPHAHGRQQHLQAHLHPVDAVGVTDAEGVSERGAHQRRDDAHHEGQDDGDPLPSGQDEPAECTTTSPTTIAEMIPPISMMSSLCSPPNCARPVGVKLEL
jgi:hypothetical protein